MQASYIYIHQIRSNIDIACITQAKFYTMNRKRRMPRADRVGAVISFDAQSSKSKASQPTGMAR